MIVTSKGGPRYMATSTTTSSALPSQNVAALLTPPKSSGPALSVSEPGSRGRRSTISVSNGGYKQNQALLPPAVAAKQQQIKQ